MFLHVACNTSFNWHDAHVDRLPHLLELTWCSLATSSLWILVVLCWGLNFVEFWSIQSLCVRIITTSRATPHHTWFDDASILFDDALSFSCVCVPTPIVLVMFPFKMVTGSRKGFLVILGSLDSCIYTQWISPNWVMFSLLLAILLSVIIHHS